MSYDPRMDAWCAKRDNFIKKRKSNILHDWELVKDHGDATTEYCKRCYLKSVFRKADNARYLKTHMRDFLQPHGRTAKLFEWEYGKPNYEALEEITDEDVKDLEI